MDLFSLLVALAATAIAPPDARPPVASPETGVSADAEAVAAALSGPDLALSMRGATVEVIAAVTPGDAGCSAVVAAHAPGKRKVWSREFRWDEVAWIGNAADGRTTVAFFEPEGRLPGDTVTFSPTDGTGFRAALTRISRGCRALRGESERVAFGAQGPMRSCYFPRLPSLQLIDTQAASPAALPARAMLSLLSRENPQGELQLLIERAASDRSAGGDDWGEPVVAFVFADPRMKDMRITSARFALDAKPVAANNAVAGYGETRVRIMMDPFAPPASGKAQTSFYHRLSSSREVTLGLLDASGQSRVELRFDAGPALAAARAALRAADWSCASAIPASAPAARWQAAE